MLSIHCFTQGMFTHYIRIQTCPQVQIVNEYDGFGFAAKKINTCQQYIAAANPYSSHKNINVERVLSGIQHSYEFIEEDNVIK